MFDADGLLLSMPAEWTDVVAADPFVVVAAGRSPFHTAGLLERPVLVTVMRARRSPFSITGVNRITP